MKHAVCVNGLICDIFIPPDRKGYIAIAHSQLLAPSAYTRIQTQMHCVAILEK
jgi:hypothetical protein